MRQNNDQFLPLDYISWCSFMSFSVSSVIIGLCLPEISNELNLNSVEGGLTESLRNFALMFGLLIFAIFATTIGKKIFSFNGQYLLALGLLCASFAPSYPLLLVSLIFIGFGGGIIEGVINPLIVDLHPNNTNKYVNIANAFFPVGVVIAAIIFGQLLYMDVSWRIIFRIAAFFAFLIGILFSVSRFPRSLDSENFNIQIIYRLFKMRIFWILAAALFLAAGVESAFTFWSRTYISNFLSDNIRIGTFAVVVFSSSMAIGRFLSVKLSNLLSEIGLMFLSAILGIIASLLIPFTFSILSFYLMLALAGFSAACFWPMILIVAARLIHTNNSALFSLLALFGISGFGIFPAVIGYLSQIFNLRIAIFILPLAFALLIILIFRVQKYAQNH
ncbi:MAG: MFS transporter [Alphaproteobacteria bacterium]